MALICCINASAAEYFLIGDATNAVWDNGIPTRQTKLIEISANVFTWTGPLKPAAEGFKILSSTLDWNDDVYHPSTGGLAIDVAGTDNMVHNGDDTKWTVSTEGIYTITMTLGETPTLKCESANLGIEKIDGAYQIGTAEQLYNFSRYINSGAIDRASNAVLTADINYTSTDEYLSKLYKEGYIGVHQDYAYKGTFDGKGHTITIDLIDHAKYDRTGLFSYINAATIKNLHVDGVITMSHHNCAGGLGGRSDGDGTLIENCVSSVTITDLGENEKDGTYGGLFANMEAKVTVKNCAFYGTINAPKCHGNGGFVGWAGGGSNVTFENCIVAPTSIIWNSAKEDGGATIARNTPTVKNCYAKDVPANGFGYVGGTTVELITTEQLQSPEFIFTTLNGNSSAPWCLTIDTDDKPYSCGGIHLPIYANAKQNCDGTPKEGETVTYSNANTADRDEHVFGENGICTVCHEGNQAPVKNGEFYEIANAGNFRWYAEVVNAGEIAAKGKLMNDIDFQGVGYIMIGTASNRWEGQLFGQGFRVKNISITGAGEDRAMVAYAKGGAKINGLIVDKSCTFNGEGTMAAFIANAQGISEGKDWLHIENCGNEADVTGTGDKANNCAAYVACCYGGDLKIRIVNSYNTGNVSGKNESAIFSGWLGSDASIIHYCWNTGNVVAGVDGSNTLARKTPDGTFKGTFDLGNAGKDKNAATVLDGATAESVANGHLAYMINIANGTDIWYQNLGGETADAQPVLDNTHGKVYFNGIYNCAGDMITSAYSNTETENTIPEHQDFVNGVCPGCHKLNQEPASVEGVYQIANAGNLRSFAKIVGDGENAANAVLLGDIDLDGLTYSPIGGRNEEGGKPYKGTFDGKGFRIKNMVINVQGKNQGLFGCLTGGAVVKNVIIDGSSSVTTYGDWMGQAAGLVGCAEGSGDILIERCGNEARVDAASANAAGIIACVYSGEIYLTIKDCYNTGDIKGTHESATFSGWLADHATVINCWNSGQVLWGQDGENALFRGNNVAVTNCYNTINNGNNCTQITAEQIASGELAFKLGNKVWYQTLGEGGDAHPVFDATHGVVGQENGSVYDNSATVEPGEDMYCTYYNSTVAYVMPEGCEGYVAYYDENNEWQFVKTYDAGQVVPAGVAVVVKSAAGEAYTLEYTAEPGETPAISALAGTDTETALEADDASYFYALQYAANNDPATIGFYWMNDTGAEFTNAANKAYLKVAKSVTEGQANAKGFAFEDDGQATGITSVNSAENNGAVYNLAGQRVKSTTKGILIKNGRKYINK